MSSKEIVFLIEDDKQYLDMYEQILNTEFETVAFTNAKDALLKFKELTPKTILLDLNLPDMNGIEFCEKLFSEYCTNTDVDIIIVSGETAPLSKLTAFDAGVADYLTKPFELKELVFKVKNSIKRKLKEERLVADTKENQQLIYTTMEQASQYSQVMSFFKNLSKCDNIDEVASVFFESMKYFGLNSSIKFKLPKDNYYRSDGIEISPIEIEVYTLLEPKGRLYMFSSRMIVNDEHVSFIIKNPPSDENSLGQIRDYTAAMIEGLEAKTLELYSQAGMGKAILELSENIGELKFGVGQPNKIINSVMTNIMVEIAGSYHSLEMTEPQELFLNKLIEAATEELSNAEEILVEIMTRLEDLKLQMEKVQEAGHHKGLDSDELSNDELF
jgi:CheY-like chemotaxis protein